jgi:hypothetical protein
MSTRSKNSYSKPQDPMMCVLAFLAMLVLLVIAFKL